MLVLNDIKVTRAFGCVFSQSLSLSCLNPNSVAREPLGLAHIESETSIMITMLLLLSRIPKKLMAAPVPVPPTEPMVPGCIANPELCPAADIIAGCVGSFGALSDGKGGSSIFAAPLLNIRFGTAAGTRFVFS